MATRNVCPRIDVIILDGAALVNFLKPANCKTFADYADDVFIKCDLSRENAQQRFSVERLKPLATCWVPVGGVDESAEGVGKAVGFFSLPVEGVEKSRWEISPKQLETLEKAIGLFSLTC